MAIWRYPEICAELGYRSPTSPREDVKVGLLPPFIQVSPRCVGLPDYEVRQIAAAKVAGRTPDEIRALVKKLVQRRALALEEAGAA